MTADLRNPPDALVEAVARVISDECEADSGHRMTWSTARFIARAAIRAAADFAEGETDA